MLKVLVNIFQQREEFDEENKVKLPKKMKSN